MFSVTNQGTYAGLTVVGSRPHSPNVPFPLTHFSPPCSTRLLLKSLTFSKFEFLVQIQSSFDFELLTSVLQCLTF